jgi:hypothetical protein
MCLHAQGSNSAQQLPAVRVATPVVAPLPAGIGRGKMRAPSASEQPIMPPVVPASPGCPRSALIPAPGGMHAPLR